MDIPVEALDALNVLRNRFGHSLVAVYLYGSAVSGGLRPHSDVDLLVVTNAPTTPSLRLALVEDLMGVSGRYPAPPGGRRPIELVVFCNADLQPLRAPPRAEFLYGEWLRSGFEAGGTPEPETNPDFALLLAQARQQAHVLVGPEPASLLPEVSAAAVRQAIGDALPALLASLVGDERNVLLTLARMWVTLATGAFVSKDAAAGWARPRLGPDAAALITAANDAYLGRIEDRWLATPEQTGRAAGELAAEVRALL